MELKYIIAIAITAAVAFIATASVVITIITRIQKRNSNEDEYVMSSGKFTVESQLSKLDANAYRAYSKIKYRSKDNQIHQIDNIVVSKYGIYVVIVKNWTGKITGNDVNKYWYKGDYKGVRNLLNPIKENDKNIEFLSRAFKINKKAFVPIICYTKLDDDDLINTYHLVVSPDDLVKSIKGLKSKPILNDNQIKRICGTINNSFKANEIELTKYESKLHEINNIVRRKHRQSK